MATKMVKSQAFVPSEDQITEAQSLLQEDSFNGESINPALETLYAELGMTDNAEATVHVTLLNADNTGKEANIWRGNPEDYDLEQLAKQFGSGDYRVKIYVRAANGSKPLRANKVFSWKLSPKDEETRRNPPKSDTPQPAFNPLDLAKVIAEAVRAAMPPPAALPPPVNTMAQMREFAELMAIMRPPEAVHAPAGNALGNMRDMIEIMEMMRGGRDDAPAVGSATGNDLMLKMIDKFSPLFMNVLAQQGGQAPGAPQLPALLQQQATPFDPQFAPQPVQPTQPTQNEADEVNIKLRMGISFLLQQCDAGGAPETYAEVVLDSVPADAVQTLINSAAPLDYLAGFDVRCKVEPYAAWLTALIVACREMLTPETDEEVKK